MAEQDLLIPQIDDMKALKPTCIFLKTPHLLNIHMTCECGYLLDILTMPFRGLSRSYDQ